MLTKEYDLKQNEALILNEILNQQFGTSLVLTIQGFIKMETIRFCLFVCFGFIYRPTLEFFTHMETSLLLVKGCKVWPMLHLSSQS